MHRSEYLEKKKSELESILNNEILQNFSNQLFAKKLTFFEFRFSEDYLWRRALYLSSKGSLILENDSKNEIALESVRNAAEIYENLYAVSEKYDKNYSILLSSLCYDISGYQANAACLVNELLELNGFYNLDNHETNSYENVLKYENLILKTLQLFLYKKIFLINNEIRFLEQNDYKAELPHYDDLFYNYLEFLRSFKDFILTGNDNNYLDSFNSCYEDSINSGNVFISHILGLLKSRLNLFKTQNIWDVIESQGKLPNKIWENYLKLLVSDIYDNNKLKKEEDRNSIFEFWKSQLIAIEKGILVNEDNFIIQMPTSAGKTLIAELMIVDSLINNPGSKCVYIAPFRSLTYEVEETLSKRLENLGWHVSSAMGSYELDDFQDFWIENTDILIATPEKIDLLFRNKPDFFEDVSIVIIDEGHLIGDKGKRSTLLEFLIIKLKMKLGEMSRFLFISAVIPKDSSKELSIWLSGNPTNVISSPVIFDKEWQPTRKLFGFFEWYKKKEAGQIVYHIGKKRPYLSNIIRSENYGDVKFPDKNSTSFKFETAASLAYELVDKGNILIFISRADWVRYMGGHLLRLVELKDEYDNSKNQFAEKRSDSVEIAEKWIGNEDIVTKCLKRGIGLHYGSLSQELKKSIEKDFREKRLDVLIATNTIAQGVNFPIKTIIVHSLIRDPRNGTKVSPYDFWNIVGRAGRAGKETEGQVIFLKFKDEDMELFEQFLDINNLKNVESNLIQIIRRLQRRFRTTEQEDRFETKIRLLIEPHFLNILLEESVDTEDEDLIEEMIGHSLFKIQADQRGLNIIPLKKRLISIANWYRSVIEDDKLRRVYSKNGFHLRSSVLISKFILENIDDLLLKAQSEDVSGILKIMMDILPFISEMRRGKLKDDVIEENLEDLYLFTCKWISGSSISVLTDCWLTLFSENALKKKMQIYINGYLEYRYPWGMSVFLDLLDYHLKNHIKSNRSVLSEELKSIPVFVKYGLNDNIACMAKTIGLKTRESCIILSKNYDGPNNFTDFLKWVSGLNFEYISSYEMSEFEKKNLIEVIIKLSSENMDINELQSREYWIQGIKYENQRKILSKEIKGGELLTLQRDYENVYDIYAIKIVYNDLIVGYVPRSISKAFSVDIDLNESKFSALILDKQKNDDFYELKFQIIEIN